MSEIKDWVKEKLSKGFTEEEISHYMLTHGYEKNYVNSLMTDIVPKKGKKNVKTGTLITIILLLIFLAGLAFLAIGEIRYDLISNLFNQGSVPEPISS